VARELAEMIFGHDTPLRLDAAAKIAFPDGGMTANGLRRESKRGRLVIERVAGTDYAGATAVVTNVRVEPDCDQGSDSAVALLEWLACTSRTA